MWDQAKKIRGSDISFNTSTSQQIDANTIKTHFVFMSTDPSYKISPTKATTINIRHQHQQLTQYSVLHMLTKACLSGTAPSWSGFATQQQLQQLQSLIKKLIRFNYLPASYPTVTQIFNILNSRLFKKHGTLDFVAAKSGYEITVITVETAGEFLDYALVTFLLPMRKAKPHIITKLVRCWKRYDKAAFRSSLMTTRGLHGKLRANFPANTRGKTEGWEQKLERNSRGGNETRGKTAGRIFFVREVPWDGKNFRGKTAVDLTLMAKFQN
ncbi:hypothetical protein HELRODRAFT_181222 [Helobdella robusta]|uniref:Uncharacterized protein n=1 Tax=Helobdella robusta TaxID=6412 RepID=T1FGR7_HELRO|nr:hypothetical protein HELRODRAFT_181222 [Helobdella robusta]ESN93126.1 hypothetical protein HELRODRAFT_181222 [Helobdella robusta]